jgi:two-component system LytT family sensor kinase
MAWLRRWLVLAALWSIPGVVQATSIYAVYMIKGDDSLSLGTALIWRIPEWQVWALATPLILWAGKRWPVTRAPWKTVPIHLVLATAIMFVDITVYFHLGRVLSSESWFDEPYGDVALVFLLKNIFFELVIYGAVLIADQAIAYQRRYREAQLAQSQLEARLVEAQLDALKQQLHPHFLFNTMNAITVLMRKGETASAIRMLNGLSELLRRSLTSLRVGWVSLAEELDFIERYLEIETTRFPDRLRVTMDISDEARRAKFPSLLLQPIVENAIEHGIAPRIDGGRITIRARVRGDRLSIEVADDGAGLTGESPGSRHRESADSPQHHGVGLDNVRKRLAQLYPDRHTVKLVPGDPRGTVTAIDIPFELHAEDAA